MQNPVSELKGLLTSAKSLPGWVTLCVLPHCLLSFHLKHCNWLEKGNPLSFRNVLTSCWTFPPVVSESFKYIYFPYMFVILTQFWALGWLCVFLCVLVCVLKLNHSYCFLCKTRMQLLCCCQMSLPKVCFLSFLLLHTHFQNPMNLN